MLIRGQAPLSYCTHFPNIQLPSLVPVCLRSSQREERRGDEVMLLLFNGTAWKLRGSLLLTSHRPEPKLHGHSHVPGSREIWFLLGSHVQPKVPLC